MRGMLPAFKRSHSLLDLKVFNFFMFGSWSLLTPFLPLFFQQRDFSNVQIGILLAMGPMISLIANPFWGYWSDRSQNVRFILLLMLVGNLLVSQVFFQADVFIASLLLMLLFYFFHTALNPLSTSLILSTIEHTPYQFGTFRLWGSLGYAFVVLAASPFIEWVGIGNLGYLYGGLLIITILLCLKLPKAAKGPAVRKMSMKDLGQILRNKPYLLFLVFSALISIPSFMNSAFLSVAINDLGGSEVYVGWSWFLAAALEVPVFLLLDRYLKVNLRSLFALMVVSAGIYTIRWWLMMLALEPMHMIWIQMLHCLSFAMSFYLSTQICDLLVDKRFRTTGQAIYGLTWMGIGGVFGGLLGGGLFEQGGAVLMYEWGTWMSLVGVAGFVAIWLYYLRQPLRANQA